MTNLRRLIVVLLWLMVTGMPANAVLAESKIDIVVETVLASQDSDHIDPSLTDLVEELQSVFRYSSYRLLSENHLSLSVGETGRVSLPGERILMITPAGTKENRAEMQLLILKKDEEIFKTVIQLINKGNIVVGGPKHKDGVLLFNISASF